MTLSKVRKDNYAVVQGWMITDLNLKGNELLVYAIIYGFSQNGDGQRYTGSIQYLADWTNTTKRSVMNNLTSLVEKGYIEKNEVIKNGVRFCEYYASYFITSEKFSPGGGEKNSPGSEKSSPGGGENFSPNNIDNDNTINKSILNNIDIGTRKNNASVVYYPLDDNLNQTFADYVEMRKRIKKPMATERAITLAKNKLQDLSKGDNEKAIQILEQSIMNSWQGLFPLKQDGKKQSNFFTANGERDILSEWRNS
jgi:hypothetical protein